jgi:hypothetical protein
MWTFGDIEDVVETGENEGGVGVVFVVDWISLFVVE